MSRVGKKPLPIPSTIVVTLDRTTLVVKGPKGELRRTLHPHVTVTQKEQTLLVTVAEPDDPFDRALWGLSRKLIANMMEGVVSGYTKKLELHGVGYKAAVAGQQLTLSIGFSHPVLVPLPEGVTATVDKNTFVTLMSANRELLGNVAAHIRAFRKPEPYKGKGIRYAGEVVRLKPGKAAKAAGGAGGGGAA